VLDRLGAAGEFDGSRAIIDGASLRAKKGDRGPDQIRSIAASPARRSTSCQTGLVPLVLGVSGANMHDSQAFEPLLQGIPKVRSRRGPRRRKPAKIHAYKAYDIPDCHRALRERRIGDRIARRGAESSTRLGRRPWAVRKAGISVELPIKIGRKTQGDMTSERQSWWCEPGGARITDTDWNSTLRRHAKRVLLGATALAVTAGATVAAISTAQADFL
jgi:hypothetical protein